MAGKKYKSKKSYATKNKDSRARRREKRRDQRELLKETLS